jgi:hypothetical protein
MAANSDLTDQERLTRLHDLACLLYLNKSEAIKTHCRIADELADAELIADAREVSAALRKFYADVNERLLRL